MNDGGIGRVFWSAVLQAAIPGPDVLGARFFKYEAAGISCGKALGGMERY